MLFIREVDQVASIQKNAKESQGIFKNLDQLQKTIRIAFFSASILHESLKSSQEFMNLKETH